MADFAELIYNSASKVADSQGKGLAESLNNGMQTGLKARELDQNAVTQAATLALKQEELIQNKQKLAQDQKNVAEAKIDKMYDYLDKVQNYKTAGAKNHFLKGAILRRGALGIDSQAIPDDQIMSLSLDENTGRLNALAIQRANGELNTTQLMKILSDREAFAQVIPILPEATRDVDLGDIEKEFLGRQSAERQAKAKAGQQGITNTVELRKELTNHPVSKDTFVIRSSFDRIKSAFGDKPSAAGDITGITAYMKMQDPISSVREGEFKTAQFAASVPDRIKNYYNQVSKGQLLNPAQRKDFVFQAQKMYDVQMAKQQAVNDQYAQIAKTSGIDPQQIIAGTNMKPVKSGDASGSGLIKMGNGKEYPAEVLKGWLDKDPNHPLAAEIKKKLRIK